MINQWVRYGLATRRANHVLDDDIHQEINLGQVAIVRLAVAQLDHLCVYAILGQYRGH